MRGESGPGELETYGAQEVALPPSAPIGMEEALWFGGGSPEPFRRILADFIAARPDGRPDAGRHPGGITGKSLPHGRNGLLYDSQGDPTPAGMDDADRPAFHVSEYDRHTIRGEYAEYDTGAAGHEGVTLWS